ncbi:MAG: ABC transporter ATP-binding protein [Candidatus Melainabacteria bacterium]|nr:ABC transporter ATP-binding protein [Candidatus Melainabacteria bacterium]
MDALIEVKNATLRFRIYRNRTPALKETVIRVLSPRKVRADEILEFDALKDLNLSIKGGDRLGIIGLNGAGKSTLLKMIVGIYPPQRGTVHVKGKVTPLIELGTGFDHELSGRENIYLNGSLLGRSFKQMRSLEAAIVEFSGLEDKIDMPIKYYSSGMLGRLAFSIGTIMEPEILLIDEVFSTGDAQFVEKAKMRMEQLISKSSIVVVVSHSMEHIVQFCNRVIVLEKGKLVAEGEPFEMVNYYRVNIAKVDPLPLPETLTQPVVSMPAAAAARPVLIS